MPARTAKFTKVAGHELHNDQEMSASEAYAIGQELQRSLTVAVAHPKRKLVRRTPWLACVCFMSMAVVAAVVAVRQFDEVLDSTLLASVVGVFSRNLSISFSMSADAQSQPSHEPSTGSASPAPSSPEGRTEQSTVAEVFHTPPSPPTNRRMSTPPSPPPWWFTGSPSLPPWWVDASASPPTPPPTPCTWLEERGTNVREQIPPAWCSIFDSDRAACELAYVRHSLTGEYQRCAYADVSSRCTLQQTWLPCAAMKLSPRPPPHPVFPSIPPSRPSSRPPPRPSPPSPALPTPTSPPVRPPFAPLEPGFFIFAPSPPAPLPLIPHHKVPTHPKHPKQANVTSTRHPHAHPDGSREGEGVEGNSSDSVGEHSERPEPLVLGHFQSVSEHVASLNARFRAGRPSVSIRRGGVLMRQFDRLVRSGALASQTIAFDTQL